MNVNFYRPLNHSTASLFQEKFLAVLTSPQTATIKAIALGIFQVLAVAFLAVVFVKGGELLYDVFTRQKLDPKILDGIMKTGNKTKLFLHLSQASKAGPSIEKLELKNFKDIDDEDLKFIAFHCPHLKELSLFKAEMTGSGLEHFKELKTLYLFDCNKIRDAGLAYVEKMPCLKKLSWINCLYLTGKSFAYLTKLETLMIEGIGPSDICDDDLALLETSSSLWKLSINSPRFCNLITDKGVESLSKLSILYDLRIHTDEITDQGLAFFKNCNYLRNLSFLGGSKISGSGLADLPSSLKSLYFLVTDKFDPKNFKSLSNFSSLNSLTLQFQYRSNKQDCLPDLVVNLPHSLKNLSLGVVNDAVLNCLKKIPLQPFRLDLWASLQISDDSLKDVKELPLNSLRLDRCPNITDKGCSYLKDMTHLKKLKLETLNISDKGLMELVDMPGLELSCKDLKNTTSQGREDFKKLFKGEILSWV